MKKMLCLSISLLFFLAGGSAQNVEETQKKETVRLNGTVNFSTQAVSPLLGSVLSPNPQLSAELRSYYKGFGVSLYRSSDLLDSKSMANFFSFAPNYYKSFGQQWSLYSALHFEFYDKVKQANLVAPYIILSKKGWINTDVFLGYGHFFEGSDLVGTIIGLSKTLEGITLKISSADIYMINSGWNCSVIGEISKEIFPKMTLGMAYNYLNFNTPQKMGCGVVKLGYRF